MDVVRLRTVAGLHADALRAIQPAVLRWRLPRSAWRILGGSAERRPAILSQLGPPHPAADLLRRTPGLGRLTCAGTSPGTAAREAPAMSPAPSSTSPAWTRPPS